MPSREVSYELLISYAAGQLDGKQAALVERYLQSNAQAAQTVARFRLAQRVTASDQGVEPSPAAIARAIELFAKHRPVAQKAGWLQTLDRIVASLIFDSRLHHASVRYAGGSTSDRMNLSYQSPQAEIDLQAERRVVEDTRANSIRWHVMGQFSANEAGESGGVPVAISRTGSHEPIAETLADGAGVFTFDVEPGTYDVLIGFADRIVVLENISIT